MQNEARFFIIHIQLVKINIRERGIFSCKRMAKAVATFG